MDQVCGYSLYVFVPPDGSIGKTILFVCDSGYVFCQFCHLEIAQLPVGWGPL